MRLNSIPPLKWLMMQKKNKKIHSLLNFNIYITLIYKTIVVCLNLKILLAIAEYVMASFPRREQMSAVFI
jgi:hypothetical protein